jgi:PmbA protein
MIEDALELALKRARAAEIVVHEERMSSAEYEDDKLKRVSASQSLDLAVRVIVDDKVGSSTATDEGEAEAAVARAIELAEFGSDARFDFPGPAPGAAVATFDPQVELITREELVAAGGEMLERIKSHSPEIKTSAESAWVVSRGRIINSSGLDVSADYSTQVGYVSGLLIRGTDMLFAGRLHYWRSKTLDVRKLTDAAIVEFRRAERTAHLATKEMPVIFTPRGMQVILVPLLMGVNGKNVLKGDSPLTHRLGEPIAGPGFSLADDRTLDFAPESAPYDGEGTPGQRNEIVRSGVLSAFLYDLETASKAGARSTGNGPGCAASNTIVAPGDVCFDDMVKGTKEGVIVEQVLGLGQGNVINGDFSVNIALGYKIENGEIVGRVKDAMVAGNVYQALPRIEATGSEPEWSYSTYSPAIKFASLSVVAGG